MPFEYQPELRGALLELRPLGPGDFDALFEAASDPLIWDQHPERNRHEEPVFRLFLQDALDSGGTLIAIDASTGRVVGSSRFWGYDEAASEVEIGWTFLAREYWGGIYNGEMKKLMLEHAFRFVRSVVFLVGTENRRSQRAVEKIGAVVVGRRRDAGGRDCYLYRITASTYAE